MESYRTEEEQVEALRRWWSENGRSTLVAVVLALGLGFGYQGWKDYRQNQAEAASDLYQRMLQAYSAPALSPEQQKIAVQLAEQLRADFEGSTYAQFAALRLAQAAVDGNDLARAQEQLRWVLGKADKGSDVALIAQLRLARVMAAAGEPEQALAILEQGDEGAYKASYAIARGDVLLGQGRAEEAREAYSAALALAAGDGQRIDLVAVQQKLQALNPRPVRVTVAAEAVVGETNASGEASAASTAEAAAGAAPSTGAGNEE